MKLICGLGNPGNEYARHRHNVGFHVVDALLGSAKASLTQDKFDGRIGQATLAGQKVLLLEPQTFMNCSGDALSGAARFYKLGPEDVLVVHDELDLPFGRLQLKAGGGAGGHNGLKSIVERWGIDAFARLRFGVGKPEGPNAKDRVVGHVLAPFSTDERAAMGPLIDRAVEACELWVAQGLGVAMNRFNRR